MTVETSMLASWCPSCGSLRQEERPGCYNPWHRQILVHLQSEPLGTSGSQCSAACDDAIDDPPSQLTVDKAFVSCAKCIRLVRTGKLNPGPPPSTKIDGASDWSDPVLVMFGHHRALSEDQIDNATPEDLRTAYRELRTHCIALITHSTQLWNELQSKGDPR